MSALTFLQLKDLALYAHYRLFKDGYYDQGDLMVHGELKLVGAGKFATEECIRALIRSRHLRRGKSNQSVPIITGPGISRIERLLSTEQNFLNTMKSKFFSKRSPGHTLRITGLGEGTDDDTVLHFSMNFEYGFMDA